MLRFSRRFFLAAFVGGQAGLTIDFPEATAIPKNFPGTPKDAQPSDLEGLVGVL